MRFKKLRIIIAVSLILFTFIVANIVVFGMLGNKSVSGGKDKQLDLSIPITYNKTSTQVNVVDNTQSSVSTSKSSTSTTSTSGSTTTTTVTHTTRTTRAS